MKKLAVVIICMFMLINIQVKAEEVEGLHENLSELILENNFTQEQIADMDRQYVEHFNEIWPGQLKGYKFLGKMETNSDEEEYEYRLSNARPVFNMGVKITLLSQYKYIKTYFENGVFNNLLDKEYWAIPNKMGENAPHGYDLNGKRIQSIKQEYSSTYGGLDIHNDNIKFIKDEEKIQKMLLEAGETKVMDMKIFNILSSNIFLLITCDKKEYLINLYASTGWDDAMEGIEQYKLYPAEEVLSQISERKTVLQKEKPMYETEAKELQSEGLLHGNENGLDLLKPLTRIEAAAMLLRALGKEETAEENSVQIFSDVPSTHWGYGAAEQAYKAGLIKGVGDDKFAPEKTVTATEFSTMVLRASGSDDFDWTQALNILIEDGIITEEQSETMDLFTRGDMAKIIYESRNEGLLN